MIPVSNRAREIWDAVRAGQIDIVRGLLQQGVNPEARSKNGLSAIEVDLAKPNVRYYVK